jgi:tetratricopeptide (TPR) repeat protein
VIQSTAAARERELSGRLAIANSAAENSNQELRTANESLEHQRGELAAGLAREQSERQRAQLNLDYALDAVDTMLTRVGDQTLAQVPRMEEVRRDLLEDAQKFYARFLDQKSDDPEVRLRQAITLRKVGRIFSQLGRNEDADCTLALAETSLRELEARSPMTGALREALCITLADRADLMMELGRFERAEELQRELLDRLERALAARPEKRTFLHEELASVHMDLSDLEHARGASAAALRHASDAVLYIDLLLQATPSSPRLMSKRGVVLSAWADLEIAAHDAEAGERQYLEALEWLRSAQRARPNDMVFLEHLGVTLINFGAAASAAEQQRGQSRLRVSAEELLDEAILVFAQLVEQYPKSLRYREALAASDTNLCSHLTRHERTAEARQYGERAVEQYQRLAELDPITPRHHSDVGFALNTLAKLCMRDGEPDVALALSERALTAQQRALSRAPNSAVFASRLASHLAAQGKALLALQRWREAAESARKMSNVGGRELWRRTTAADLLVGCARAAEEDGSLSDAERAQEREMLRDEAVRTLALAVDEGLSPAALVNLPSFESLKDQEAFRQLAGLSQDDP